MKRISKLNLVISFLFSMAFILPVHASDADFYTSKLSNNSKTADGYYLVQDKIWSEKGCVVDTGKDKLNPGDTATLKIKKDCKWGVVKYQIHKMKDDASMGFLAHSFHDGEFSLEITKKCSNNNCIFRDLSLEQN